MFGVARRKSLRRKDRFWISHYITLSSPLGGSGGRSSDSFTLSGLSLHPANPVDSTLRVLTFKAKRHQMHCG